MSDYVNVKRLKRLKLMVVFFRSWSDLFSPSCARVSCFRHFEIFVCVWGSDDDLTERKKRITTDGDPFSPFLIAFNFCCANGLASRMQDG